MKKVEFKEFDHANITNQVPKSFRLIIDNTRFHVSKIKSIFSEGGNYKLDPQYQRNYTWNDEMASLLIESLILNIPIPPIYLFEVNLDDYEVLDGRQRITTIINFLDNKLCLNELTTLKDLNGCSIDDLENNFPNEYGNFKRSQISGIILLKESAQDKSEEEAMKRLIFQRINRQGEKITDQQMRNALYSGPGLKLIKDYSRDNVIIEMLSSLSKKKSKNYNDFINDELILRICSYKYFDQFNSKSDKEFYDKVLVYMNEFNEEVLVQKKFLSDLIIFIDEYDLKHIFKIVGAKSKRSNASVRYILDPMTYFLHTVYKDNNKFDKELAEFLSMENLKKFYEEKFAEFNGQDQNTSDVNRRQKIYYDEFTK